MSSRTILPVGRNGMSADAARCASVAEAHIIQNEESGLLLVYLFRHAIAEERDPLNGGDDFARALTRRGIERMNRNVQGLSSIGVQLQAIWTSPLIRARQTADLLVPLLDRPCQVVTTVDLAPGGDHDTVLSQIARLEGIDAVALVGHEPDMGELGSRLLFESQSYAMTFKKGGVACIEVDESHASLRGILRWMLTPKQMNAMADRVEA
jgi:phosphohistidine phosphatase